MKRQHLKILNKTAKGNGIYKYSIPFRKKNKEEEAIEEQKDYTVQRASFKNDFDQFARQILFRRKQRHAELKISHFEYIIIHSFRILGDDLIKKWGLQLINRTNWGLTLTAQIADMKAFRAFMLDIRKYATDDSIVHQVPQEFKVLTLIESFELLSSEHIIRISDKHLKTNVVMTELASEGKKQIYNELVRIVGRDNIRPISEQMQLYEVEFESIDTIKYIADNLDIIQQIQSVPTWHVSPSRFKMVNFEQDLRIDKTDINDLPVIGLIDTGVRDIKVINDLIVERVQLDGITTVACGHGTNVASLILFGRQPLDQPLVPQAKIYSIQVMENDHGRISLSQLKQKIIKGIEKYRIKVFNISMSDTVSKDINEGISEYATVLDEIAYNYDVLFVTATGNIFWNAEEYAPYPYEHYNPQNPQLSTSSNVGAPAECMNGITVGAVDSLPNGLPAVYTKKSHLDFTMPFGKAYAEKAIMNDNLIKPDVLSEGGDDVHGEAGMIDVIEGGGYEFIRKSFGTSLATPLISNLCARIIKQYPSLQASSIKSLVINIASPTRFQDLEEVKEIIQLRNVQLTNIPNVRSYHRLTAGRFCRMIEGHGVVPRDDSNAILSDDNEVTFVGEDSLRNNEIKCISLRLPDQLVRNGKRQEVKLVVSATLSFMAQTVPDDIVRYNPFHVSFRFLRGREKIDDVLNAVIYEIGVPEEERKACRMMLKIKSSLEHWSDTPLPSYKKRLFSNTQHKIFYLNYSDIVNTEHNIAIAFRCVTKPGFEKTDVPFSYVIRLKMVDEKLIGDGFNLYDELTAINDLRIINDIELEAEVEL